MEGICEGICEGIANPMTPYGGETWELSNPKDNSQDAKNRTGSAILVDRTA